MATIRSCSGSVTVGGTAVGEVTNFGYDERTEVEEWSVIGNCATQTDGGSISGSGTVACMHDPADAQQVSMWDAIDTGSNVTLAYYPEGDSSGKQEFAGSVTIEQIAMAAEASGRVRSDFTFKGRLTRATVTP